ncbi:MAG: AMP-binding protein [Roseinatronobacter sp.]|nr:AMP-binding protein [Roseinatronobacter sp.]
MSAVSATPPEGTVRQWLELRAQTQASDPAFLFPDSETLTWSDLRDAAAEIAARIAGQGLRKGDCVAIMLPNSRQGILCLFGALYGGFRTALINLVAGAEAIGYALSHSEAKIILLGKAQSDLFEQAAQAHAVTAPTVAVGAVIEWPIAQGRATLDEIAPQDASILMYTSGTTGRPKGVLHTHASLLAGGWTASLAHALCPEDRALCVLPIYHINGLCVTIMGPLVSGGSALVCDKFSASKFWNLCKEYQVTWFSVVPTIISHLLHGAANPDRATTARIRFGRSASSALAIETQTAFQARFGIPIIETMGLTETAAQILSNPLPPGTRKIGSPGRAFGNDVVILSKDLMPVAHGLEGEIAVRGPNVMTCYFRNPEATRDTFTPDGWLRTGDLGCMDADGYVFVTGRLKELIIKGGENIAPREVDEALYGHPDVVEAAAFARHCAQYGERVEAAVKLRDGATVRSDELVALCRRKLGDFKCPDVIHILDDLPKGPSGKIQRLKLAEETKEKA